MICASFFLFKEKTGDIKMKHLKAIIASIALFAMFAGTSLQAKVEIQWWHAFGGRLGELLDEQVNKFNASQNKYTVVHTRKGNYSETLNAGIAAFRAGQHPNILMVFEVGTASLMAAKGCLLYTSPSPRDRYQH